MTITADSAHDNLSILGGDGFVTVESIAKATTPDTLYIDVDLAPLSGLSVSGRQLYTVVDNSTIAINGSGQLYAIGGSAALNDLFDVQIIYQQTGDVLAYNASTAKWQDQNMSVGGQTGQASGVGVNAYGDINSSTSNAATGSHTHPMGSVTGIATGSHTHRLPDFNNEESSGPSNSFFIISSTGGPDITRSVMTSVSPTYQWVPRKTHRHSSGGIDPVIS